VAKKAEEEREPAPVKSWAFKGKSYYKNSDNEVWKKGSDGSLGDWVGIYMPSEDRIDDSVADPDAESYDA